MIIRDNFLLDLHRNKCCDPSSELSQDDSDEGPQHIISMRNKKNYPSVIIKYFHLFRAVFLLPESL